MEIDYRRNLVTDENVICEKLTDFTSLFGELTFEERTELLGLIVKEISVTRFDPEKDPHPCDSAVFVNQMRTSWYQVDFRFYANSLNLKGLRGKSETVSTVRNKKESGGQ